MPLRIVRNDITKMKVDAIVNAANETLLGGGGVDGAIHRAAGAGLLAACARLGGCKTGASKLTKGYQLPCKYVIHTVGPVWRGGGCGERELLASCYRTALDLAKRKKCASVAFPLISSGAYGYPKDQALRVAVEEIGAFCLENEMTVYLVVFDRASYSIGEALFSDIQTFVDDRYADAHSAQRSERIRMMNAPKADAAPRPDQPPRPAAPYGAKPAEDTLELEAPRPDQPPRPAALYGAKPTEDTLELEAPRPDQPPRPAAPYGADPAEDTVEFEALRPMCAPAAPAPQASAMPRSLRDALRRMDESFSEMLLRKIDESGMTDAECYKRANIDRKLFSKIRGDKRYKPSKPTAIAFAIALRLPLDETADLLRKAGFALSRSNKFDIIIEYFIENGNYNIFEINEALFAFDQSLLGA